MSRGGKPRPLGARFAALLVTSLLTMTMACSATPPAVDHGAANAALDFQLPDLDGRSVSPRDYRGRVLLVDIWASWCKPCKVALPFYAELQERYRKQGLTILGVNVDESKEALLTFLAKQPLPFEVLHDPKGTLPDAIGLETMPTSVLISRQGQVLYVHPGFVDGDQQAVQRRIVDALAQAPAR